MTYSPFYVGPSFNPNTSDLTGVSTETLRSWLSQAQLAYFTLSAGGQVASAQYSQGDGSKSVTYRAADIGHLTALIGLLKAQLGIFGYRRRPANMVFR